MPSLTTKLGLKKPLGTEINNRAKYNENLDLIDLNVASQQDLDTHKADFVRNPAWGQTTGGTTAYLFASTPTLPALVDGVSAYIDINATNTGAVTLNWDGKGAKSIVKAQGASLVPLIAGDLLINGIYGVRYNSSTGNFQLVGKGADVLTGNLTAGDLISGVTGYSNDPLTKITGTLALTPTAVAGDIAVGKTVYLTDPKNAVTGTGANVKKKAFANNVTCVATTFTVTGLTFQPSVIICDIKVGNGTTVRRCSYYSDANVLSDTLSQNQNTISAQYNSTGQYTNGSIVGYSVFTPNATGFTLTTMNATDNICWVAYE